MKELALHILDIAQNSINAEATLIEITIIEDTQNDIFMLEIKDNGRGMKEETLKKVDNPFFTTRTTRKIGLGISLLKAAALQSEGSFNIVSKQGEGTIVRASFKHSHIDRMPLGHIDDTFAILLMVENEIDYIYTHCHNDNKYSINTYDIKKILGQVPIRNPDVIDWVRRDIKDGIKKIRQN